MITAIAGLNTYRYAGRYGFIYIGAANVAEALREAARSTVEPIDASKLELILGV